MKIGTYLVFLVSGHYTFFSLQKPSSHFRSLRSNDFSSHLAVSFTQLPFGWARTHRTTDTYFFVCTDKKL